MDREITFIVRRCDRQTLANAPIADGTFSVWSRPADFAINTQVALVNIPPDFATSVPSIPWMPLPGAAKYDVWLDNLSTGTSQFIREPDQAASPFTPGTELPLGRYRMWVRAIDAADKPALWSAPVTFAILTRPIVVTPNLATFFTKPEFTWTPVPGATRYELWVDNVSTGVSQFIYEPNLTTESFTPSADMPNGSYRYWVRAFGPGGMPGRYSPDRMLQIGGRPSVTTPSGVTSKTNPIISWTQVDGAAAYDLWVNRTDVPQSEIIREQALTTTQFQTPELPTGTYRVWVRASTSSSVYSDWSKPFSFSIDSTDAAAPTMLTPSSSTFDATPTFTWTALPGATRYVLYVRNAVTLDVPILESQLTTESFTPATELVPGSYLAWVRAYAVNDALGKWSAPLSFDVVGPPDLTIDQSGAVGRPQFLWAPVTLATHYELLVDRLDVALDAVINETNLTGLNFTPVTPLVTGTYRAWIRAVNASGEATVWSIPVDFSVAATSSADSDVLLAALLQEELVDSGLTELSGKPGIRALRNDWHTNTVTAAAVNQSTSDPADYQSDGNKTQSPAAIMPTITPVTSSAYITRRSRLVFDELPADDLEGSMIETVLQELALGRTL